MEKTASTVHFLRTTSLDIENDDDIEVVPEQEEIPKQRLSFPQRARKSILDDLKYFQDAIARKKLTRWIMVLGGVFLILSAILLIVTLNMSKDIDEKVRDSNHLLRKQSDREMTNLHNSGNITTS